MTRDEQNDTIRRLWAEGAPSRVIAELVSLSHQGVINRATALEVPKGQRERQPWEIEGDSALLYMQGGKIIAVDLADLESVSRHRWNVRTSAHLAYAESWIGMERVSLHRFLLPGEVEIDHVDRDGLNNRRANIRPCTHSENMRNRRKPKMPTTSHYKGVSWSRQHRGWVAKICRDHSRTHLGVFSTEAEAARAYDAAALRLHGEFARTNTDEGLYREPTIADLRRAAVSVNRRRR